MKAFVTYYRNRDDLHSFISDNKIINSSSLLIQVFTSKNDEKFIKKLLSELSEKLSHAVIIGSSTDGEIANGEISKNGTVITFTLFKNASLKCAFDSSKDSLDRGKKLANKLLKSNSKIFILFSEGLHTNGEEFLKGIQNVAPSVKVAGGLAGDYAKFEKTLVFTKDKIISNGAVGVSINSDTIKIFNDYNFNWQKIGKKLKITKAKDNIVYEIDGRSAIDTYKHYLGDRVVQKIPAVCIEFPLLVEDNGIYTARSVISALDDGSLVFCANIKEGSEVYFGYGNPEEILKHTKTIPRKLEKFKPEALFVYSCMARRHFIGEMINQELEPLDKFAPMGGFFTYGEFFSSKSNQFFNQTMTVLALSEDDKSKDDIETKDEVDNDIEWNSMNALIHLVNKTTQELVEYKSFKEAYSKFEQIFEYSGNAVAVISSGEFVECNQRVVNLFDYSSKQEFLRSDILDVIDESHRDTFKAKLKEIESHIEDEKVQEYQFELLANSKSNRIFWIEVVLTSVFMDENNKIIYVAYKDINERKEIECSLQKQRDMLFYKAYHDDLTGLANRKYFMETLQKEIESTEEKIAILFIDLDKLKIINDSLGHDIGDVMIKTVANRIKDCVGKKGFVARLGGDEFMVMLYNIKTISQIKETTEDILATVQKPIDLGIHTFYSSASIGIAIYPDDSRDKSALLKYSDTAMYKAKDNGGNGYFFYESSMTQKAFAQIKMEEAFIHAFRNHEFEIYYLPQYDMENRSIKSVEALVRWRHPMRGFLAPDEFLPYIEKLNLLYRLDKWMMNSAMKDFVKWKKMGIAPEKLSLNIRMAELANEQWERKVLKTMKRLSFESSWLELEISEREIMKHPDRVVALLDSMHRHGISIVIDDFGTGYSSIKQLKALPIDKIKIDKSLVVDLIVDEESLFMSNIIIAVAKSMGVAIMAEGVETEAQAKILAKHGCSYAQGYYYSKPMSREEIVGCLSEAKRLNS